jgi:hypothetical protein
MNPLQASWRRVQDENISYKDRSLKQGLFLHPEQSDFLDDMISPRSTVTSTHRRVLVVLRCCERHASVQVKGSNVGSFKVCKILWWDMVVELLKR